MIIAVDGPSGAGKSTIAKLMSKRLNFQYIDTGAMYRALAYKSYKNNIEICDSKIDKMLLSTKIEYFDNNIFLDGENVEAYIRSENISLLTSQIATLKNVREKMVEVQRNISKDKNVILDGRDIGTNVFPNAEFKFFVTASEKVRAKRRYDEQISKGQDVNYDDILSDIKKRDVNDSTRQISPLEMAHDAMLIDTTDMSIEEVINRMSSVVLEELNVL